MMNLKPNALIYGARYDKVMEAFGGSVPSSRIRKTSRRPSMRR